MVRKSQLLTAGLAGILTATAPSVATADREVITPGRSITIGDKTVVCETPGPEPRVEYVAQPDTCGENFQELASIPGIDVGCVEIQPSGDGYVTSQGDTVYGTFRNECLSSPNENYTCAITFDRPTAENELLDIDGPTIHLEGNPGNLETVLTQSPNANVSLEAASVEECAEAGFPEILDHNVTVEGNDVNVTVRYCEDPVGTGSGESSETGEPQVDLLDRVLNSPAVFAQAGPLIPVSRSPVVGTKFVAGIDISPDSGRYFNLRVGQGVLVQQLPDSVEYVESPPQEVDGGWGPRSEYVDIDSTLTTTTAGPVYMIPLEGRIGGSIPITRKVDLGLSFGGGIMVSPTSTSTESIQTREHWLDGTLVETQTTSDTVDSNGHQASGYLTFGMSADFELPRRNGQLGVLSVGLDALYNNRIDLDNVEGQSSGFSVVPYLRITGGRSATRQGLATVQNARLEMLNERRLEDLQNSRQSDSQNDLYSGE